MSSCVTTRNSATIALSASGTSTARSTPQSSAEESEVVVLARRGKPPLRFKGSLLSRHQSASPDGLHIIVELWKQTKRGLVISYSYFDGGKIANRAIQVSNLDEASDCLENVCANLGPSDMKTSGFDPCWPDLQHYLYFRQKFLFLVADVLADWHLMPQLQEPV